MAQNTGKDFLSVSSSGDNLHSSPFTISRCSAFCKQAGSAMFISEYLTSKIIKYEKRTLHGAYFYRDWKERTLYEDCYFMFVYITSHTHTYPSWSFLCIFMHFGIENGVKHLGGKIRWVKTKKSKFFFL